MYNDEIFISVTEEHIKKGIRYSAQYCPVAKACSQRNLNAWVSPGYISILTDDGCIDVYKLPQEATQFINDFDSQRTVHPFAFSAFRVK